MNFIHETAGDAAVWRALAHPTRRRILDALFEKPRTTGGIVEALGLERHAVMAHLAVLREADLVLTESVGRLRINRLNVVPIQQIHSRWVDPVEAPWAAALIAVRDQVESSSSTGAGAISQSASPHTSHVGEDVG